MSEDPRRPTSSDRRSYPPSLYCSRRRTPRAYVRDATELIRRRFHPNVRSPPPPLHRRCRHPTNMLHCAPPSNARRRRCVMLVDFVRHVPFERGTLPAWVGTPRCTSFGNITLVGYTHDNSNNATTTIPDENANVGATIVTMPRSSSSFVVRCIARSRRHCRRIVVVAASVGMASSCRPPTGGRS